MNHIYKNRLITVDITTDHFTELHKLVTRELERTTDAIDQIGGTPFEDLRSDLENTAKILTHINENFNDVSFGISLFNDDE